MKQVNRSRRRGQYRVGLASARRRFERRAARARRRPWVIAVVASLAVLLRLTGHYQPLGSISPRSYLFLLLSGLATGASWLCYFRALKLGPAALVAPVDKSSVVLVALLGVGLLGERLELRQWCGIALVGAGVALLAWR